MAARDDHEVRRIIDGEAGKGAIEIFGDDFLGLREALAIGVGFAIVHYGDVETGAAGGLVEFVANMACAKDVELWRRKNGFDKNFQGASADQAGVVLGILVEIEGERARFFAGDDLACSLPDLALDAAAADGSGDGAIVADQHLRALERWNGTAHVDDGGQGSLAARPLQLHDLFVDVHSI